MSETILSLSNITFSYEGRPPALKGFSVDIHAGERIAVLGSNGAGKSTFFLCANGVLAPQEGEIRCGGKVLTRKKEDLRLLRRSVGLVFQEADHMLLAPTVYEEVSFGPMNLGFSRAETAERVAEALSAVHMDAYRDRPPHDLSGGEKKRVSIADVLAMRPDVLLFDEPTASLDPRSAAQFEALLGRWSEGGRAVVIATHDIDFAWRWADRLLVMDQGALLADGRAPDVFADDALLARTGLRRPYLFEVSRLLHLPPAAAPRTVEELRTLLP